MSDKDSLDKSAMRYVQGLIDDGPAAIYDAITQRDAIIAKLMIGLGTKEVRLHAINDPPSLQEPFGLHMSIDPNDPQIVVLQVKDAADYTVAHRKSLN